MPKSTEPIDKRRIVLLDDGTMDTVLGCIECTAEIRGNYDGSWGSDEGDPDDRYRSWLEAFIKETEEEHECGDPL